MINMKTVKEDDGKRSSSGKIRLMLLIFSVLITSVGCVIGLFVLTQRTSKMEELLQELQSWKETCSQQKSVLHDDSTNLRARRDITLATIEGVRNEIRVQLRSVIASQVCSTPEKVCLPGTPGTKGEPGLQGRIGRKGGPGQTGDAYFGPKGEPGYDGTPGEQGDPGPKGYRGDKGDTGDPGSPGSSSRGGSGDLNPSIPTVYVSPDVLHVVESAPATFACIAFGKPSPSVVWKRADGGVVMNSGGKLTITQARPEDAGKYVCTAFNGVGKANATAELIVQGKPAIFSFTSKVTAKPYDDVKLLCQAKGYPRPTVQWARADSRTLPQDRAEQEGNNLVIRGIRLEDSGVYVCRARNFYGTVRDRVEVSIIPRTGKNRKDAVRNCKELQSHFPGVPSGTYWVDLDLGSPDNAFQTYCDQDTEGGGWTLVWSYVILAPPRSYFTPRPDFPEHGIYIYNSPISYTPPLNESYRGALNFSLWSVIGREVLLKSNLINWFICKDNSGSVVTFRPGSISCRTLESPKNVPYCDAYPTTLKTGFNFGFTLSSRASRYSSLYKVVISSSRRAGDAVLDACGRGRPNRNIKKNVDVPEGSWYVR